MSNDLTIDLPAFYDEVARLLNASWGSDRGYNRGYGETRQRDAYYAVKIAGFEVIPVGRKLCSLCGHDAQAVYTHIYNRKTSKPDLQYLIAPDTRVPNYTTSLDDSIELANIAGFNALKIPTWPHYNVKQFYIDQILAACDAVIGCEYPDDR